MFFSHFQNLPMPFLKNPCFKSYSFKSSSFTNSASQRSFCHSKFSSSRSSHRRCCIEKGVHRKTQKNTCVWALFNKDAGCLFKVHSKTKEVLNKVVPVKNKRIKRNSQEWFYNDISEKRSKEIYFWIFLRDPKASCR